MISFQPTDEQQMIADTVRDFAREQIAPHGGAASERRELPRPVLQAARELGLVAATIPEKYGGYAESYSAVTGVLVAEALAQGDLSMALHLLAPAAVATPLLHAGTESQKERWLPRFTETDFFASAALVEPVWDFDPAALSTKAQRSAEGYVLTGRKSHVVQPGLDERAHLLLVYAHDIDADGSRAFLLPASTEGVIVGERERGMGLDALRYHSVTFDEVEVPAAARLGGEDASDVTPLLDHSAITATALATGLAAASYEYAQSYAKAREAFGKPVAQFQSIAFMLAEMRIAVESMRMLCWEAAWQLERGDEATRAAVVARQYADEYVLQVTDRAVQILGGHGYIRDYPVERWLREARLFGAVHF